MSTPTRTHCSVILNTNVENSQHSNATFVERNLNGTIILASIYDILIKLLKFLYNFPEFYCNKRCDSFKIFNQLYFFTDITFPCYNCGRYYRSKVALNRHIKYDCGKEKKFRCTACSYRAYQKVHVKAHFVRIHNKSVQQ